MLVEIQITPLVQVWDGVVVMEFWMFGLEHLVELGQWVILLVVEL